MRLISFLICLYCVSCNSSEKPINTTNIPSSAKKGNSQTPHEQSLPKSIKEIANKIWAPHHAANPFYSSHVSFNDEYVAYNFDSECVYYFFTNTTYAKDYQQVQLLWTFKKDCKYELPFLNSNHLKDYDYPNNGEVFATYRLENDTTLSVEYVFPKFVSKVNELAQDSIFPSQLYLVPIHD